MQVWVEKNKECSQYRIDLIRFSFKFNCIQPSATCILTSYFELHGVEQIRDNANNE